MLLMVGLALAVSVLRVHAQEETSAPVLQLQDYCKRDIPTGYSPRLGVLTLTPKGNIHYLFPLYHGLKDEEKFRKLYSDKGYYDEMSQYFAFAGDYRTALQYLVKGYDSIDDGTRRKIYRTADNLTGIEHADARLYIHLAAKNRRVVMINEAFAKPLHRAFTLSLLEDLYRMGFRYLALEMLNNFANQRLSSVGMHSGYYVCEPVAGELMRKAIELGYTLVSYEDTAASVHSANQRDSVQAANLNEILKKDSTAKILVHASFAHISKKKDPDGHVPMALAFWRLSGIEPLTIDQTDMTEESNFGYGRVIYQAYTTKFKISGPSIALLNNAPVNVTDKDLYDLCVIHPPTQYLDGRPTWLNLNGTRQPTYIKSPSSAVFLVQAYYQQEIENNDNTPWQLVPADQTYTPGGRDGMGRVRYLLYLRKGKYKIFFRDINYHILSTLPIEVN
ncbi:hypothetical protein GCM10011511_03380 [Puia dinghuensis]|uniref:Erythromycin esterase family protein n=2 Tax=Puia dinghuensis TaxID=1792502 RepID=A0A8J2U7E8_9BACT|nr:hypothetical protein GCM10011511_03380 [Puia dinghuensis]